MDSRNNRRRRTRPSMRYRIGKIFAAVSRACKNALQAIAKLFAKLLPARKPGDPIWKSARLIAGAAAGVVCVGVVLLIVLLPGGSGEKKPHAGEQESVEAAATVAPAPVSTAEPVIYYMDCKDSPEISKLQERLIEIGYFDADETTEHFGPATDLAVRRFQLLNGYSKEEADGKVDEALWNKIFSDGYAEYILKVGMEGEDIRDLQSRLRDLGYLSTNPTGYYGTDTEAALKEFQQKNGLEIDGMIDEETGDKLYSEDVVSLYFKKGDKNDEIKELQARLKKLGYMTFEPDGEYGNATLAAVKLFQQKNDLVVDGYIGYETKVLLMSKEAKMNVLSKGDEGADVTKLQNRLVKLGYINKTTGYFGSDTEAAVKNFQKTNGLSADGAAGAKTLAKLNSSDAIKAKKKVVIGASSKVNSFLAAAKSKLGCKYVRGAKGPNKFDCSGLVFWCLKQAGVKQKYVTSVTWRKEGNYKTIKDIDSVRAGDVICYAPHHVGIAISGNTMIDASSSNGKVVQRSFKTPYWRRSFVCARRVF